MVDVVYILGRGSPSKDQELHYSLQSVCRFLGGVRKVFFVGAFPRTSLSGFSWAHIPLTDHHRLPACNINDCLREACRAQEVSETFLRMDDDCILLKPQAAETMPSYCRGSLRAHIEWFKTRPGNPYEQCLRQTEAWLKAQAFPQVNFEIHGPMLFHKPSLLSILDRLDPTVGFLTRTIYGNILKLPGTQISDCKISENLSPSQLVERTRGRPFFSFGDKGLNQALWSFLDGRFNSGQRITA
jgi:hypothetical protein